MKILAIFDFCETLVDFQSLGRFLELAQTKNPAFLKRHEMPKRKFRFLPRFIRRKLGLYPVKMPEIPRVHFEALRGFALQDAEKLAKDYTQNELLKRVNSRVIRKLEWHKAQGHEIYIVSGGLWLYIREFAKHFDIPQTHIVAIELESKDGVLTGNMDGIHTMEHRKLYKLDDMVDLGEFDIQKSYFYSDCVSDIPLLSFVGNPVVIECGKDTRWAKILGYEIL